MARTNTLGNFLTDVAEAIRTAEGSSETIQASDFDIRIEALSGGGGAVVEKDVNFYDYDGTLVNSYTKNEFLALNEMPANPTHNGLTAQGWNWSLEGAKQHVNKYDAIDIGEMYVTDDNKTRLYVSITDYTLDPTLSIGINGTATIDWGDGKIDTISGTSTTTETSIQHIYEQPGNYVISIDSQETFYFNPVSRGAYSTILGCGDFTSRGASVSKRYLYTLYKIEFGSTANISKYAALYDARKLKTITIPSQLTSFGNGLCFGSIIEHITFPRNAVFDQNMISSSYIKTVSIGEGTTSLQDAANVSFSSMTVLKKFIIPDNYSKILKLHDFRLLEKFNIPQGVTTISFGGYTPFRKIDLSSYTNIIKVGFTSNRIVDEIILPNSITNFDTTFSQCDALTKVVNFDKVNVSQLPNSCFYYCYSLIDVSLPSVNSIPYGCFSTCYSLKNIVIPETVKTLSDNAFFYCASLEYLELPNITSIGASCFSNCTSMKYYDFSNCTVVPTLANKNAFTNIPSDCKIIVPDDLYEDWIVATNWSTYADYIISKSDWDALQNA